jgi:hypothetical protein
MHSKLREELPGSDNELRAVEDEVWDEIKADMEALAQIFQSASSLSAGVVSKRSKLQVRFLRRGAQAMTSARKSCGRRAYQLPPSLARANRAERAGDLLLLRALASLLCSSRIGR